MLNLHFVAQMSVERLLNGLGEGVAIALFTWMLLRVMGRRNSGTRFAVWFCALVAIALAPFLEMPSGTAIAHPAAVVMPRAWSLYLFVAWAAIALVGLSRVMAGLWHLHTLRRACVPVESLGNGGFPDPAPKGAVENDPYTASVKRGSDTSHEFFREAFSLDPMVARTLGESRRRIEVCTSDPLLVPTAIGLFKPAVVIPSWALRELSPAELNAVVLHEVAHLRRWDDWTNLAQKILRALFFFHPAVWWVESRLSLEREMACDDMVLAQTANPRAYAECLVSLAEKNLLQRGIALAQAAVGRMRQTSLRVLQILDAGRPNAVRVWKPAPWVVAGFSVACLLSAAHAPKLVAFGDPNTMTQLSATATGTLSSDSQPFVPRVVPASFVSHEGTAEFANSAARRSNGSATVRGRMGASRASKFAASRLNGQTVKPAGDQASPAVQRTIHRSDPHRSNAVRLVRTGATESQPIAVPQETVFVFVQGQQFGDGPVLWHVSIWRVTVNYQTAPQVAPEVSSKST
jgi:Zn-dependent protease with chaperone function